MQFTTPSEVRLASIPVSATSMLPCTTTIPNFACMRPSPCFPIICRTTTQRCNSTPEYLEPFSFLFSVAEGIMLHNNNKEWLRPPRHGHAATCLRCGFLCSCNLRLFRRTTSLPGRCATTEVDLATVQFLVVTVLSYLSLLVALSTAGAHSDLQAVFFA